MTTTATTHCPVCGSDKRTPAEDGMGKARPDSGIHYLKHAAAELKITAQELGDAVKIQKCGDCGAYYCDPWLSPQTASFVFTAGAPDHIAGWGTFEHWLSSDRPNSWQSGTRKLYAFLEKEIGPIASYAEFACPFQGFLLQFRQQELSTAERITLFKKAMNRPADIRWTKTTRIHHAAGKIANTLTVLYHRYRRLKEAPKGIPIDHFPNLPKRRILFTQDTIQAWSNNCTRYGQNCRYYANRVLDADVLPLDLKALRGLEPVDLLGIFNSLDHTPDPIQTLEKGLAVAKHIIVATHNAAFAGKQHLFAFPEDFPNWLSNRLNGASIRDITEKISEPGKRQIDTILISRNSYNAPP